VKKLAVLALSALGFVAVGAAPALARDHGPDVSFGLFFGVPQVVYDDDDDYERAQAWAAHERWVAHRRWEEERREEERARIEREEHCERERARAAYEERIRYWRLAHHDWDD
jgi:hypothetical protein